MSAPGLVEDARLALRLSCRDYDAEVEALVDAALADMRRVGVREEALSGPSPLVRHAACLFCKARFGFDSPDAARFDELYRAAVADLLNSEENGSSGAVG